jgi:hypothetical protein
VPSRLYSDALVNASLLKDDELIELHRHVSRLARAAYGRQPRYQENYRNSQPAARAKIEAARRKSSPEPSAEAAT